MLEVLQYMVSMFIYIFVDENVSLFFILLPFLLEKLTNTQFFISVVLIYVESIWF